MFVSETTFPKIHLKYGTYKLNIEKNYSNRTTYILYL